MWYVMLTASESRSALFVPRRVPSSSPRLAAPLLLLLSGFVPRAEPRRGHLLQDIGADKRRKMALHVPKAPGFAQMLKDGAKVSLSPRPGLVTLKFIAS